ncbi:hypothetical protein D1007_04130 [Hordeum vulgare]|nr:hypothetical protein D1007_04130 [Hordeum vulgare]
MPDEVGYLDSFTKVLERLEAGAQEVAGLIEEESRDLLSQALTSVFNNLFHIEPYFNFEAAIAPVLETSRGTLGKVVKDHVNALSAIRPRQLRESCGAMGHAVDEGDDEDKAYGDDDDGDESCTSL